MDIAYKKLWYGSVVVYQCFCPECNESYLEKKPLVKLYCENCGYNSQEEKRPKFKGMKIVVPAIKTKGKLSKKERLKLIEKQGNLCYWCGRPFGMVYYRKNRIYELKPHADHKVPFIYCYGNEIENFVMACNLCNLFKSSKVFSDEVQVRDCVNDRWEQETRNGTIIFSQGILGAV